MLDAFDSLKLTGVIKFKRNNAVQRGKKDGTQESVNAPPCVVAYNKYTLYGQC